MLNVFLLFCISLKILCFSYTCEETVPHLALLSRSLGYAKSFCYMIKEIKKVKEEHSKGPQNQDILKKAGFAFAACHFALKLAGCSKNMTASLKIAASGLQCAKVADSVDKAYYTFKAIEGMGEIEEDFNKSYLSGIGITLTGILENEKKCKWNFAMLKKNHHLRNFGRKAAYELYFLNTSISALTSLQTKDQKILEPKDMFTQMIALYILLDQVIESLPEVLSFATDICKIAENRHFEAARRLRTSTPR